MLYKCTTAISTAEAWTAGHWTAVKVMPEMNAAVAGVNGEVQSLKEDLNITNVGYFNLLSEDAFDFTNVEQSNFGISGIDKWTSSSVQKSYTFAILSDVKAVTVTANSTGGIVAFLNSYEPVSGQLADLSTHHPHRIELSANETKKFIVAGNMNYMYVLLKSTSGVDKTPVVNLCYDKTDTTLTQAHVPADSASVGAVIADKFPEYAQFVEYTGADLSGFGISNIGQWTSSSVAKYLVFRLDGIKKIKATANDTGGIIAFLNSYEPVSRGLVDFAPGYSARIELSAGEIAEYNVTDGMNYMFVLIIDTSANDRAPTVEVTKDGVSNMLYPVDFETADETGKTDRSEEINAILATTGYCHLSKGVYYIGKGIKMPANSMLVGSGANTVIKLIETVASGSAIVMNASCTVKDLNVKGSTSGKASATTGTKYGIEWTGEELTAGVVDNCTVQNFDGGGIYLHDTTQKTYRNLSIINCYVVRNRIGIYIRKDSEFNKITACTIIANGIGYLNRGGNNDICNCGLDANTVGVQIDMDEGDNNGHGTISNCSINHSDHNSGYGLVIKDTGRMLVNNCNIYYSKVKLDTTDGNVISACGFGRDADWEILNGACNLFIGCMVRGWDAENSPVTITNNEKVKIVNCFDREGNAYSA